MTSEVLGGIDVSVGEYVGKGTCVVEVVAVSQSRGPVIRYILSLTLRSRSRGH